jgi:superfamily II DNA or RNA helicase
MTQITLDFSIKNEPVYIGRPVYLKTDKNLGIGIISLVDAEKFKITFTGDVQKSIARESDKLVFLPTDLSALHNQEIISGELILSLLSLELKLTHIFDKLSSLSNSRTRLLPHQIESTYIVVNSLKHRFILADEVGLGKTIEAALIMKELIFRKDYKNVLIITPSPLMVQWRTELKNKFNEDFKIIKRNNFLTQSDLNWSNYNRIITSIDFIKNPKYTEEILKRKWDIVIFDEAHRLRRDYSKITRAYLFAEKISKRTECLLLLTATPFRGKLEELYYLTHLVDPNILGSYHAFVNDYIIGNKSDLREKISKVLLRRRKVEIGGFTKRFAKTVMIELSEEERQFYEETTNYVRQEYNLALQTKNRAIGFVMVVFQKLLDSSVFALITALSKRKFLLENRLSRIYQNPIENEDWDIDETEGIEDFVSDMESSAWKDFANTKREILTLNRLIHLGKTIERDSKSIKLKETLQKLSRLGHEKFIIFTQFRSTQEYLYSILEGEFKVSLFHGSLSMDAKEDAITDFKNSAEVLICTEAGGEGRNLQFSNILFNYDLPWSPLKIEQRIGRIHRFGQKKDVYIFNFASKDTVAERILEVLTNKIRLFEESIGVSDALLGNIEAEVDFNTTFMKFISGSKTKRELEDEFDLRIKVAEQGFKRLDTLVTPKLIDFNLQDYYNHTLDERQFDNSHLEKFINEFISYFPGITNVSLEKVNNKIYKMKTENREKLATFDSETALQDDTLEFLAFGHPLVENAINYFANNKLGFGYKVIKSKEFNNKIFYIYIADFSFSLRRSELFYYLYDRESKIVEKIDTLPINIKSSISNVSPAYIERLEMEIGLIHTFNKCEKDSEVFKNQLENKTALLFQKEANKLELTTQKSVRMLKEKLERQTARSLWEGKSDRSPAINRTKNEITKVNEEYERELRKIKNSSRITKSIEIFQIYYCI